MASPSSKAVGMLRWDFIFEQGWMGIGVMDFGRVQELKDRRKFRRLKAGRSLIYQTLLGERYAGLRDRE
jgi:hypothetical protein